MNMETINEIAKLVDKIVEEENKLKHTDATIHDIKILKAVLMLTIAYKEWKRNYEINNN